jgi:hypothetical protein
MSFVTTIRDYVEVLNTITDSIGNNFTINNFISESFLYIFKTLQFWILYLVSFQWIRDFTLLPIVLPQASSAIFKETFFLETPSKVFFEFLEIPDLNQNKFILGFFNSFFLSLPVSVVQILAIRRLLIQGIPAAVYSIGAYIIGQVLFLALTVFGVRQILVPWLTLEPLNYILGVILIFRIIYSMTQENLKELNGWFLPQYKNYFLTSFLLAWCEQSSIYQYLGNLTLTSNVSVLESFSSNSSISSFFAHFLYIFGILVGSGVFTLIWGFFFLQVKNWCILYTPLFLSSFIQLINKTSFVITLALSLSSIPFYGFDYLITGPLGFVSQDSVFKHTLLDQYNVKDSIGVVSGPASQNKDVEIDVSPFDRGRYLLSLDSPQPLSFEDLNYRGEFDWTARYDKLSGISDSKTGLFTLAKVFKKQKIVQPETKSTLNEKLDFNNLISEKRQGYDPTALEADPQIIQRFTDWYDVLDDDSENAELTKPYRELYNVSFPTDYLRAESVIEKEIEQKIKDKYYSNPVYKTLLSLDIDLFLNRQPKDFKLTGDQEVDLYTKRRVLQSYYDSLRYYSKLPYSENFDEFFDGAKSFSNKVYNQQFKGTLRSVRRLFSLTIDPRSEDNTNLQAVLKFDQPLYQLSEKEKFSPYHEELITQSNLLKDNKNDFLIKPLYAGWDENLRKFVITNKFLPRTLAGYKVNIDTETSGKFYQDSNKKKGQKIKFTTWPLLSQTVLGEKNQLDISYVTLFEPKTKEIEQIFSENFSTLPSNVESFKRKQTQTQEPQDVFEFLAPKRGGFIWHGNSKIKLPFYEK